MHRWISRTSVALMALGFAATASAPAMANSSDVTRQGGCSHNASWKVKAKPDNGRLEVEGEVDSNVRGQTWHWRILHDGRVSMRGKATTGGRSGSFTVERRIINTRGSDRVGWRAVNRNTGETCRGGVTI